MFFFIGFNRKGRIEV